MTETVTCLTPTCKPSRMIAVILPLVHDEPSVGVVKIDDGKRAEEYLVWRQPAQFPYTKGFRMAKLSDCDHDGYDVLIDQAQPKLSTCECIGFLRWGTRKPCRHIAGLTALMKCGKLS